MDDGILVERAEAVATVTLNRPDRLNALMKPMWLGLTRAVTGLAGDAAVRCIVLRGAGKAFSPGADVSEFETERADAERAAAYGDVMEETYAAFRACPHPMVAAIRGPCTGVGLVLALLADLRIAAADARFGVPVSRLGLAMPLPEFAILYGAVGYARALEIVLEARVFDAAEAERKGLVNRVVPDAELERAVGESARRIAAGAPLVNRWHKEFARRLAAGAPLGPEEVRNGYASFDTADYREGFRAFLEKRSPRFEGR